ncbi:ATP-binding protein [Paenibacillus eucommiae]|uniref:DNA topoisomerase (ATP-hydrolyzing) n=1 Tax=Paenibacillus eucommiae TaxID=1355755 RepID=A0ABS4IVC4_9BACL|nr:ATP-binding protein [Paenibacillus eucommiae]MBP1991533.1 DNA gyrase subunit B [Paenibacillus eucommiae]
MNRDLGQEMDLMHVQLSELRQLVQQLVEDRDKDKDRDTNREKQVVGHIFEDGGDSKRNQNGEADLEKGVIYYSGRYHNDRNGLRWEPQERQVGALLDLNGEKIAKVLSALGHKQRLDILRAALHKPLTGPELVDQLHMGTTGQLYHHIKALLGADLLVQEERGGRYEIPTHRTLPVLLLLAALSDLIDTSNYLDMTDARTQASTYLGEASKEGFDAQVLLWAVVENSIMEHLAGYCDEVRIFLHEDGSVTVSDNGRGIPVQAFPQQDRPEHRSMLTDLEWLHTQPNFIAPGAEKGISIAVVNALSYTITVEIRRDGFIKRQEFRRGIPQTGLKTIGVAEETGTRVTFMPDPEIFVPGFDVVQIEGRVESLESHYPKLKVYIHGFL